MSQIITPLTEVEMDELEYTRLETAGDPVALVDFLVSYSIAAVESGAHSEDFKMEPMKYLAMRLAETIAIRYPDDEEELRNDEIPFQGAFLKAQEEADIPWFEPS